jgi:hypothetical protein
MSEQQTAHIIFTGAVHPGESDWDLNQTGSLYVRDIRNTENGVVWQAILSGGADRTAQFSPITAQIVSLTIQLIYQIIFILSTVRTGQNERKT